MTYPLVTGVGQGLFLLVLCVGKPAHVAGSFSHFDLLMQTYLVQTTDREGNWFVCTCISEAARKHTMESPNVAFVVKFTHEEILTHDTMLALFVR